MRLTFDFRDFERVARGLDALASQIPFALARTLNDAAEAARKEIVDVTWPSHVTVRNPRFLAAALTTKGERASKRNLRVTIYDKLGRAGLQRHAVGGTKTARGGNLAIPNRPVAARRGSKGVPKNLRPRALPNAFVSDGTGKRPISKRARSTSVKDIIARPEQSRPAPGSAERRSPISAR